MILLSETEGNTYMTSTLPSQRLLFVGGGHMATALMRGLVDGGCVMVKSFRTLQSAECDDVGRPQSAVVNSERSYSAGARYPRLECSRIEL